MKSLGRTILVTGASSGIGQATVHLLASRGYRVLAGTRRPEEVGGPGGWAAGEPVEPVLLDVTQPDHVAAVAERILAECPAGLDGLVNNAGLGPPAAIELADLDELRGVFEVNALGPLRMIQACLPSLRLARGRIVNISSMNGTLVLPMVGGYSASKFALEAVSDALRIELRPWGVSVSVVRPGQVRTPIFDKARQALAERVNAIPPELRAGYQKLYDRSAQFNERGARSMTGPDDVARKVLKILECRSPAARYLVGFDAWGLQALLTLLPTRLLDRVLARASGVAAGRPAVEESNAEAKTQARR